MARYGYDRLSAQDASFLTFETANVHMHVAATQIYKANQLRTGEGGIDFDAYKRATEAVLHLIPRYRQKLEWIPFMNQAVWVDDPHFNLEYHVRHTALPRPGSEAQLKKLCARVMSQPLDRKRPLWEIWVVEGLDDDRFAVITKVHHCMIDGTSGVDLGMILMSTEPKTSVERPAPFVPRPTPGAVELWWDEFKRRLWAPVDAVSALMRLDLSGVDISEEVGVRLKALSELAGWAFQGASETPINGRLGPHRHFDWLKVPLDDVKEVRRRVGCTVNDIVLAVVAGAVRQYMIRRRVDPSRIDFRASAPVSVRSEEEQGQLGNRVSSWIVRLPIDRADPIERLQAIYETTQELKRSKQALGVQMMMAAAEWTPGMLLSLGARAASGPINTIVTNVPGPQFPLYLLNAELDAMFPQVPLLEGTGLGVALISYNGSVCWGFNAEYELIPDLQVFVQLVEESFRELQGAVAASPVSLDPSEPPRSLADVRPHAP